MEVQDDWSYKLFSLDIAKPPPSVERCLKSNTGHVRRSTPGDNHARHFHLLCCENARSSSSKYQGVDGFVNTFLHSVFPVVPQAKGGHPPPPPQEAAPSKCKQQPWLRFLLQAITLQISAQRVRKGIARSKQIGTSHPSRSSSKHTWMTDAVAAHRPHYLDSHYSFGPIYTRRISKTGEGYHAVGVHWGSISCSGFKGLLA